VKRIGNDAGEEFDISPAFFSYRAAQLQGLVNAVRDISDHALMKGVAAEQALADLLLGRLSTRYSAGKCFILAIQSANATIRMVRSNREN
jgi:hypothetical protein